MKIKWILGLIVLTGLLSGCGETFRGIGRDTSRIIYGAKTIFVSQK
ncbi:MAG: hypothetical protein HY582_02415 [Candidatus Omnitrophica bacterium]|nr:hypothetical protein [Candidatus Omnitrophota bacterium]